MEPQWGKHEHVRSGKSLRDIFGMCVAQHPIDLQAWQVWNSLECDISETMAYLAVHAYKTPLAISTISSSHQLVLYKWKL